MLTTEGGRSTSTTEIGEDDVLVFAIDGIGVRTNRPPIADAGADQTFIASSPAGSRVELYGGFSFDPDNDPLTYEWTEGATSLASGSFVEVVLTPGVHTITLTVDDGQGGVAADTVTMTVLPNTPAGGALTVTPADSAWTRSSNYLESPATVRFADVTSTGITSLTSRYLVSPVPPQACSSAVRRCTTTSRQPPASPERSTSVSTTGARASPGPTPTSGSTSRSPAHGCCCRRRTIRRRGSVCGTTTTLGTFALFTPAVAANEISLLAGQPVFTASCSRNRGIDPNEGGFATDSNLCNTRGLAYDAARNFLYFAEAGEGDAVRRIDLTTGRITTVAGTGFTQGAFDGTGGDPRDDDKNNVDPLIAPVNQVLRVALDAQGNLILAEYGTGRLRKVDFAQNLIYTIADVSAVTRPSALAIDELAPRCSPALPSATPSSGGSRREPTAS